MAHPHRGRNKVREKGQMGMRFEELRIKRKQLGMQDFLDPGKVNLRVLRLRMVALDEERPQSKEAKQQEIFKLQTGSPPTACPQPEENFS